jgi:hypothetical protein
LLNRGFLRKGDRFFRATTTNDFEALSPRAQLAKRRDVVVDVGLDQDPPVRVTNPRVLERYENADHHSGALARRRAVRRAPGSSGLGAEGVP